MKKMAYSEIFTGFALLLALAGNAAATPPSSYAKAVSDAVVADSAEVVHNLDALSADNTSLVWSQDKTMLKVVTWKSQSSYEKYLLPYPQTSSSEANVVWVTLAPKMQEFCREYMQSHPRASQKDLERRLKQRLGLNPDWQYDVFVELWVSPEDVFRPCVDPSPNDSSCELNFGSKIPQVKNIGDYRSFYQNLYYNSFRAAPGVPWTGLGYTYDWGNPHHEQGASEFILSPSSPYIVEQAMPTVEYCRP